MGWCVSDVQVNESDAKSLNGACVEVVEWGGRSLACERGALMKFLSAGRGAFEQENGVGEVRVDDEPRLLSAAGFAFDEVEPMSKKVRYTVNALDEVVVNMKSDLTGESSSRSILHACLEVSTDHRLQI